MTLYTAASVMATHSEENNTMSGITFFALLLVFVCTGANNSNLRLYGGWSDFAVDIKKCELCCGGVKFRGELVATTWCCNGKAYDTNIAGCCDDVIHHFNTSSYQWQCCGKQVLLNINTQVCCGNTVHPKREQQECCGNDVYNFNNNACCNGVILPKPSNSWACCNSVTYDRTKQRCINSQLYPIQSKTIASVCNGQHFNYIKQMCCSGNVVDRKNNYTLCCNNTSYQSNSEICCNGLVHPDHQTAILSCCGTAVFNATTQMCCDDVIHDKPRGEMCNVCCGTAVYNVTTQICCDGVIHDKPNGDKNNSYVCCAQSLYAYDDNSSICCGQTLHSISDLSQNARNSYECCGNSFYDHEKQSCCNGRRVVDGYKVKCCGSETYSVKEKICCNDELFSIDQSPDKCCWEGRRCPTHLGK